jgi:hypothetical protein
MRLKFLWPKKKSPRPLTLFTDPRIGLALAKRIAERQAQQTPQPPQPKTNLYAHH